MKRYAAGSSQFKLSLNSCRNILVYIPYNANGYDSKTQQEIVNEVERLYQESFQRKKTATELTERANSVVVEKLGIPLPDEESGVVFTNVIQVNSESRLDVLFNSPVRESILSNLWEYPHRTLGDLTKPQYEEPITPCDYYRLVELDKINEDTGTVTSAKEVPILGSDKIKFKANNILVSKLQPEKGKIVIVPTEYDGAVGSSELVPLTLESTEVSLKYLWAVLRSQYVLKQWEYALVGSSRMRIGSTELRQTIIPVPDKDIQNKIVTEIEDMLLKRDVLLDESNRLSEEAEQLFMSRVFGPY